MTALAVLPGALPEGEVLRGRASLRLAPRPDVIAEARRFVVEEVGAVDDDTCDTLRLLTSELVTNAVLHAGTELEVEVGTSQHCILVAVGDHAPPGPSRATSEREGGRGLVLVDAMAEDWALVRHEDDGTTAWFRLPRPH